MTTGIRARLLAIIALATLAPLTIAILGVQTIGYRHLVKERGAAVQAGAAHLATTIHLLARAERNKLYEYLNQERLVSFAELANERLARHSAEQLSSQIEALEARWSTLETGDPLLANLLTNQLAVDLRAFKKRHPLCAEILVTDRIGQLIASTGKTSDFFQGDEQWWREAVQSKSGLAWLEGLHFDESSSTFALDISVPLKTPEGTVAGALKASLNASALFSSLPSVLRDSSLTRDIVGGTGEVLVRLRQPRFVPGSERLNQKMMAVLQTREAGWAVGKVVEDYESLVGFAAVRLDVPGEKVSPMGLGSMFVVVHEPASVALASLRKQVTLLTLSGAALMLVFGMAGLWLATNRIIAPVALLRTAADAVAGTVQKAGTRSDPGSVKAASDKLAGLGGIRTCDELQTLARDFQVMGQRVLQYQQQLEQEIAAKTAAIQRDLDMARDFQSALMPSSYPAVPEGDCSDQLALSFQHFYRPASTVGGDFFDVLKLSQHQAGVFIADVMGHGARSALITAILRTLLQTHSKQARDPAALLSLVNRKFHELTNRTQQTIFVTALYVVVDTLKGTIACASAGHPAPLIARQENGSTIPLFSKLSGNPALGLFPRATYDTHSRSVEAGDLVLLYTDGVVEATNSAGEEFGLAGLARSFDLQRHEPKESVIDVIRKQLCEFVETGSFEDDVCLVTIDILARQRGTILKQVGVLNAGRIDN